MDLESGLRELLYILENKYVEALDLKILKKLSLIFMAIIYIFAGVMHFIKPEMYMKIMPPFIPFHMFMVYFSGVAEIALGIGLLIPRYSRLAAWGVIALLIAIYPANIYDYMNGGVGTGLTGNAGIFRLFMQFVLIAWAYWHTRE